MQIKCILFCLKNPLLLHDNLTAEFFIRIISKICFVIIKPHNITDNTAISTQQVTPLSIYKNSRTFQGLHKTNIYIFNGSTIYYGYNILGSTYYRTLACCVQVNSFFLI